MSITGTRESNNRHQYHSIKGNFNHRNQGVYQHTTDTSITASRATSITGTRESNNTQQTPVSQHQSQEPGSLPTHNRHQYHSIKGNFNHRNQGVYQHTTDTSITASRVTSITGTRESNNTQQTPVSQHQSQEPGSLPTHNRHQYHSIKGNFNHRNQGVYQHTTDTSITASRATSITGTRESNNTQQTPVSQHQGRLNRRNQGV